MRSVAFLAVLVLCLAGLKHLQVRAEGRLTDESARISVAADHSYRIFSNGYGFPAARWGFKETHQGIVVDGKSYNHPTSESGMRVLVDRCDGSRPEFKNFNLADAAGALDAFEALVNDVPVDTVIAMGAMRVVAPAEGKPQLREQMRRIMRFLGAQTSPEQSRIASYALLTIRRPQGFVPVAEQYSKARGLCLAFHLSGDHSVYDDRLCRPMIDSRFQVPLSLTTEPGDDLVVEPQGRVFNRQVAALRITARRAAPSTVELALPESVNNTAHLESLTFLASIAMRRSASASVLGVRFHLIVNGQPMTERFIYRDAGEDQRWLDWEVLLPSNITRVDSVQVQVERVGSAGPPVETWLAEPVLQIGRQHSL